jgi:ppGpp synthetase/RelA/SpoT-type nucleotidyltranferase
MPHGRLELYNDGRMTHRLSNSEIERLGARLISEEGPAAQDLALLHELLGDYDMVLGDAVQRVRSVLDVAPTARIKNTGTILEKLNRYGGSWLKSIQDLAGMRIVGDFDRTGQDAIVDHLVDVFADEARKPKVVDRRAEPVQGYRAVHIIVFPERLPLEIQVRTRRQHEWAEFFEKLSDRFGRGIRYGEPPTRLSARGLDGAQVIAVAIAMADVIGQVETAEAAPDRSDLKNAFGGVDEVFANLRRFLELL